MNFTDRLNKKICSFLDSCSIPHETDDRDKITVSLSAIVDSTEFYLWGRGANRLDLVLNVFRKTLQCQYDSNVHRITVTRNIQSDKIEIAVAELTPLMRLSTLLMKMGLTPLLSDNAVMFTVHDIEDSTYKTKKELIKVVAGKLSDCEIRCMKYNGFICIDASEKKRTQYG